MNNEYINIAIKRIEIKNPKLKSMRVDADKALKEFIKEHKTTKTNYFFRQSRVQPGLYDEYILNSPEDILGFIDDFDDEYMYCRLMKKHEHMFNHPEVWVMSPIYITDNGCEKTKIKHLLRVECIMK